MSFPANEAALPPLYARWLRELLDGPIPAETEATCQDCAMCVETDGRPPGSGYYFDPAIKCCTYVPELPNFLVGRILADETPEAAYGRESLIQRIDDGISVSPLGVGRSPTSSVLYDNIASLEGFGRSRTVRCPHYVDESGGLCSIWNHRAGVCATWFCKFVRGSIGKDFWNVLQRLLGAVEGELARWCLLELELDDSALRAMFGGNPQAPETSVLWGAWAGREQQLYRECARLVDGLGWQELSAMCGAETRLLARLTRDCHRRLTGDEASRYLRVGSFEVIWMGSDFVRISSYNLLDPLQVPRRVFEVLHYFDGSRPVLEVLAAIEEHEGIALDENLLQGLTDFDVLVPVDSP